MSQKTNSMIKLALVFFISLLSFSVGTYVGKKYSDNQYRLSQLEPNKKDSSSETLATEFANQTEPEAHTNSAKNEVKHESDSSQNLTDSEVAKIAEEFATEQPATTEASNDEKPIQTTAVEEKEIKSISEKPTPHIVKAMPAKVASVAVAKTTKVVTAEREPSSIHNTVNPTKDLAKSHFTIQIGSFPSEQDAQKMTKELLLKGIKTSYVSALVNGQTYYRVNVGLFSSAKEAQDYKKEFLQKTKISSAFVQKVQ